MKLSDLYVGVKDYFDKCAPYYSKIHIDMPYLDKWQFGNLLREVDTSMAPTVLDLGTGDGNFLRHIGMANPDCKLIGIDLSDKMLEVAKSNLEQESLTAQFIQGNAENIDLPDMHVNYVVSNGALHHVENKTSLYQEIFRVLKPGGKLFVTDGFDIFDDQTRELQAKLKKDEPEFCEGFLSDFERCMTFLRTEIPSEFEDHPEEFHIAPFELKTLLETIGYYNTRIQPSPNHIVMYIAEKLNN